MSLRGFLPELHRRRVIGVAVAYVAAAIVLLEVLTHLFHNFEVPHWVLKVLTTLLILGLPVACLSASGFESESAVGIPLRLALDSATGDITDARGLLDRTLKQYLDGHTVSGYLRPARNRNHPVIGEDPRFMLLLKRMGLQD